MKHSKNEGNIIIAEFNGRLHTTNADGDLLLSYDNGLSWYGVLYDEDWTSLMEVVDKIEEIIKPNSWYEADRAWFDIKSHSVSVHCKVAGKTFNSLWVIVKDYKKDHRENVVATKREAVWHCVVEFLAWYKLNK